MKRAIAVFLCFCMLTAAVTALPGLSITVEDTGFTDITNHWAQADILWGFENSIAYGTSKDLFSPGDPLTRGMFITFLARTARFAGDDTTPVSKVNPFADVTPADWYYEAALWAYENGIASGTDTVNDKAVFSPDARITRQETAAMLSRYLKEYLGVQINETGVSAFPDEDAIAPWAQASVRSLAALGIFKGDSQGRMNPVNEADRASAVSLCRRIYTLLRPVETNAPAVRCVAFSPLTFGIPSPAGIAFETGRVRFTAALGAESHVVVTAPDAMGESWREVDVTALLAADADTHTYDIVRLPNNALLLFRDGEEAGVVGRERTYAQPMTDEATAIGKAYQDDTEQLTPCTVRFENTDVRDGCLYRLIDESPFGLHGILRVNGNHLVDKFGKETVMRGVHLFAEAQENQYFTGYEELKWMRDDWGINCIRLGLIPYTYLQEDPDMQQLKDENMYRVIENCNRLGIYVIIDWHGYEEYPKPGQPYCKADPRIFQTEAAAFFEHFSERYADYSNIFYELYNEPTGGKAFTEQFSWDEVTKRGVTYLKGYEFTWNEIIRPYSEEMISIIRANDPDSVIIVNTPEADQHPEIAALFPFDEENLMYCVHPWSDGSMEVITVNRTVVAKQRFNTCMFATEAGFYPDEAGGFEMAGLENTIDNAIGWLHYNQERHFKTFVEAHNINYIYFVLLRGHDDDYRRMLRSDEIPIDQRSGWMDNQLTFTGEYMRHWFRKMAGLEDDTWFVNWHIENDAYYNPLIGLE